MTLETDALVREWREAAKGVTPGFPRWIHLFGQQAVYTRDPADGCRIHLVVRDDGAVDNAKLGWIARCSPLGISALLDTIEAERDAQLAETQRAWIARDGEKRLRLQAEAKLAEVEKIAGELNLKLITAKTDAELERRAHAVTNDRATALREQLERAWEALERLASPEAFTTPGMASPEDTARMKFAEAAALRTAQETK